MADPEVSVIFDGMKIDNGSQKISKRSAEDDEDDQFVSKRPKFNEISDSESSDGSDGEESNASEDSILKFLTDNLKTDDEQLNNGAIEETEVLDLDFLDVSTTMFSMFDDSSMGAHDDMANSDGLLEENEITCMSNEFNSISKEEDSNPAEDVSLTESLTGNANDDEKIDKETEETNGNPKEVIEINEKALEVTEDKALEVTEDKALEVTEDKVECAAVASEPVSVVDDSSMITDETQANKDYFEEKMIKEMSEKLTKNLDIFILKGCFGNTDRKSSIIKEMWKYCGHTYGTIEMMVRELSPFSLVAEHKLLDSLLSNCSKLKCLRLSYCEVTLDVFKQLSRIRFLSCLHLHYIYGIESSEEWTQVGSFLSHKLTNFSFASDYRQYDLSGMMSTLGAYGQLSLEEYDNDMVRLFSSLSPNLYKLSLLNYHGIDSLAIKTLSQTVPLLKELNLNYDCFHPKRANVNAIFRSISEHFLDIKKLQIKLITMTDMRPIFKLRQIKTLDLQFSCVKFLDLPPVYKSETLEHLYLTKVLLTPSRVMSLTKSFPYLVTLSLTGNVGRHHIDSAMFCCECRDKDKNHDMCPLCYQNCVIGFIELTLLERLELHYINIKSLMTLPLQYIPELKYLVINPFECLCGRSIVSAAVKISHMRTFTLAMRRVFIAEALEEECLSQDLIIVDYQREDSYDSQFYY